MVGRSEDRIFKNLTGRVTTRTRTNEIKEDNGPRTMEVEQCESMSRRQPRHKGSRERVFHRRTKRLQGVRRFAYLQRVKLVVDKSANDGDKAADLCLKERSSTCREMLLGKRRECDVCHWRDCVVRSTVERTKRQD